MADEEFLNLAREDIFPAANDHIFEAANNINVALSIHGCQVTRMQPAFAIDGFSGFLGHLVIALHDEETPAAKFAALSAGYYCTGRWLNNFHIGIGQGQAYCC